MKSFEKIQFVKGCWVTVIHEEMRKFEREKVHTTGRVIAIDNEMMTIRVLTSTDPKTATKTTIELYHPFVLYVRTISFNMENMESLKDGSILKLDGV